MDNKIKITKYTKAKENSALIAFFNMIYFSSYGPMFFNDCKLFLKDGRNWVGFPDKKFQNEQGETKYAAYMGFTDRDNSDKFCKAVLHAIGEFSKANESKQSQQPTSTPYPHANGNINSQVLTAQSNMQQNHQPDQMDLPF